MTGLDKMKELYKKEQTFEEWLEDQKDRCINEFGFFNIEGYVCGCGCEKCWENALKQEVEE